MSTWNIYVRAGRLLAPTTGVTPDGIFKDIEPVDVVELVDKPRSIAAISRVIALGNPIVPDMPRHLQSNPIVLGYAKVRSWSAFVKGCHCLGVRKRADGYEVFSMKNSPSGGWIPDLTTLDRQPIHATVQQVAEELYMKAMAAAAP